MFVSDCDYRHYSIASLDSLPIVSRITMTVLQACADGGTMVMAQLPYLFEGIGNTGYIIFTNTIY